MDSRNASNTVKFFVGGGGKPLRKRPLFGGNDINLTLLFIAAEFRDLFVKNLIGLMDRNDTRRDPETILVPLKSGPEKRDKTFQEVFFLMVELAEMGSPRQIPEEIQACFSKNISIDHQGFPPTLPDPGMKF